MNLPDEDLWDETNCSSEACQHPQCWASLRRIEKGHPRILDSPGKSSRETDDKLPTLTIVNITDTCLWTKKRVAQRQSPKFTFPKERERSLLLKPASRRHSRSQKAFHDKGVTSCSRPPKVSSMNLREEGKLPSLKMSETWVVTWVPEEMEKNMSSVGKTSAFSSWLEKRRKKLGEKSKPPLYFSGRQYMSTYSRSPGVIVPPPSPVHLFDKLGSEAIPLLAQVDMLPRDLLKECILAHEKTMTCPEVKIELAKMKKTLPLEKTRPDSAISSKMYLTVHRLTLQRPSLRYPGHLRKLQYNLKRAEGSSGYKKQQKEQQRKVKTSTKSQEAEKTVKSDVESEPIFLCCICSFLPLQVLWTVLWFLLQSEVIKRLDFIWCLPLQQWPQRGPRIPSRQESELKQKGGRKRRGRKMTSYLMIFLLQPPEDYGHKLMPPMPSHDVWFRNKSGVDWTVQSFFSHLRSVSIDDSVAYDLDTNYTDYYSSPESPELYDSVYKDLSDVGETMLGLLPSSHESSPRSLSGSMDRTGWNPDLKLLRILQASVDEDEETHLLGHRARHLWMLRLGMSYGQAYPEQFLVFEDNDLGHWIEKGLLFSGFLQRDEGLETLLFSLALQLQHE
ncbi:uncharacterized protein C9orf43 homolog [Arvicola amphibius]|uniref:uncharacterized protein C9orf43 homolog n=1 Tax=Arvicola amphibius TaxID=1047088 RepID=UPI001C092C57|nr:uncharacterized protein C9orf43 homolog [Arvicola amphibius]